MDGEIGTTKRFQSTALNKTLFEYRAEKTQTVFPPSTHPTGERIEWEMNEDCGTTYQSALLDAIGWLATATVLAKMYTQGRRQDITLALSGYLLSRGKKEAEVKRVIAAVCSFTGDEEASKRTDAVDRTIDKIARQQTVTGRTKLIDLIGSSAVFDIQKFLRLGKGDSTSVAAATNPQGPQPIDMSEAAVADLLKNELTHKLMYVQEMGTYFTYKDGLWREDKDSIIALEIFDAFVKQQIKKSVEEANWQVSVSQTKSWGKYRNCTPAKNVLHLAKGRLSKSMSYLNRDPWLFGCQNGIVNLKTGDFHDHSPEHGLTVRSSVRYNSTAKCPKFERFMDETFGGDLSLASYMKGLIGYWMTAQTDRQEFYVMHGEGANGKSTLLNIISHVLGPMATTMLTDTLFDKKRGSNAAMSDLASLQGKRLAVAQEAESAEYLSSSLIKHLTGGDAIKVKPLYRDVYEIAPTFKVVLVTNVRPMINAHDPALVRRVKLIPFANVVERKNRDPNLLAALKTESSGILNCFIEGARAYAEGTLTEPDAVVAATQDYLSVNDTVSSFLSEMVVKESGSRTSKTDAYNSYNQYCMDNGLNPLSKATFGDALKKAGFDEGRDSSTRYWMGLRLVLDPNEKFAELLKGVKPVIFGRKTG